MILFSFRKGSKQLLQSKWGQGQGIIVKKIPLKRVRIGQK